MLAIVFSFEKFHKYTFGRSDHKMLEPIPKKDNIDARSECGARMYQKLKEIQRETEADQTLEVVKPLILKGWSDEKSDLPLQAAPYHGLRDELTVYDGAI